MHTQLYVVLSGGMRLLARFVILLVVLSVLIDLIGWTSMCFDPSLPFVALSPPICFVLSSNLLIEGLEKGGLPGLLWHYLPAIVVSLSIAIAWIFVDRHRLNSERFSVKSRVNMANLPLLRRMALRFAVLLFVLAALYDLSTPLSFCFRPRPPILPRTVPICFLALFETRIFVTRMGGLPGLAWHYLPVAVVATIVMIICARKDSRGRRE